MVAILNLKWLDMDKIKTQVFDAFCSCVQGLRIQYFMAIYLIKDIYTNIKPKKI
jgi:hypothetical protein